MAASAPSQEPAQAQPTPGMAAATWEPLADLLEWPANPKDHSAEHVEQIVASVTRFGWLEPVVANRRNRMLVSGHGRRLAALSLGLDLVPVRYVDLSEEDAELAALAANRIQELSGYDDSKLAALLRKHSDRDRAGLLAAGFDGSSLLAVLRRAALSGRDDRDEARKTLAERFVVPPFSVLDARAGYWTERHRAWTEILGSNGDGRAENILFRSTAARVPDYYAQKRRAESTLGRELTDEEFEAEFLKERPTGLSATGTSTFDPVLAEVIVRWFSPPRGRVLDPFAGGAVRGVVAACLGREYVGIDLRAEQIEANRAIVARGAVALLPSAGPIRYEEPADFTPKTAVVERRGRYYVLRDDLFCVAGVRGGKVRSCWALAQGAKGLVTAGSRSSPQVNIVAHIARRLGVPCRVHTPDGPASPEVLEAVKCGAERVEHRPGYNNVIVARAREDASERGWTEIPFGMECQTAVDATAKQVKAVPADARRIVIPVGSGMSLAGVLHGLAKAKRSIPVLGVVVGADPSERLDKWAPSDWRERVTLVRSELAYDDEAADATLDGLALDPIYEAKAAPYLLEGDLLWVVGRRQTAALEPSDEKAIDPVWVEGDSRNVTSLVSGEFDLVMSCPPYGDLEKYSDDPKDLSNASDADFDAAYATIIRASCARLRDHAFAVFVVGDYRDRRGLYRNFVSRTVAAFEAAGLALYNEAILATQVASAAIRGPRAFLASRKLAKTHQNVLVFVKGDPKKAVEALGPVEVDASAK